MLLKPWNGEFVQVYRIRSAVDDWAERDFCFSRMRSYARPSVCSHRYYSSILQLYIIHRRRKRGGGGAGGPGGPGAWPPTFHPAEARQRYLSSCAPVFLRVAQCYTIYLKTLVTKYFREFRGFFSRVSRAARELCEERSHVFVKPRPTSLDALFRETFFRELLSRVKFFFERVFRYRVVVIDMSQHLLDLLFQGP